MDSDVAASSLPTAALVSAYSSRFTDRFPTEGVVSPLGMWLLLALLAPAVPSPDQRELERELGTTATDAAARATKLLGSPHPAVSAALSAWSKSASLTQAHAVWERTLRGLALTGPIPEQEDADRWACEATNGLVDRFPIRVDPRSLFVLANALAATVPWDESMRVVPGQQPDDGSPLFLDGPFGEKVSSALSPRSSIRFLAFTAAAGVVAVHAPIARCGVDVISVIADTSVAPSSVHRAALEVADLLAGRPGPARQLSLFDLPLTGHAWTVTEQLERRYGIVEPRLESVSCVVPAWTATANFDVLRAPGFSAAVGALNEFAHPEYRPVQVQARQAARAAYTADGFTAAAVTAIGFLARGMPARDSTQVLVRHAMARFNRPHAVVAVTRHGSPEWAGIPVFSAWVTEPVEAQDQTQGP